MLFPHDERMVDLVGENAYVRWMDDQNIGKTRLDRTEWFGSRPARSGELDGLNRRAIARWQRTELHCGTDHAQPHDGDSKCSKLPARICESVADN